MITSELFNSLLSNKDKYVKRSFSLKKTMITFPFDSESSAKSIVKAQTQKKINSPCIKSSQIMKKKAQRQRYVKQFDEMIADPQKLQKNQYGQASQISMKRSNSMKVPTSKLFSNLPYSREEKYRKRTISNAQRAQEADNLFGDFLQSQDNLRNTISFSRVKENIQTQRKQKYDFGQYYLNKNSQQLFTCKTLRKSTQIEFCNEQIAALINKKKTQIQSKQEDSNDETSFKAVLQKIKSKDLGQISKGHINQQKLKYVDKIKIDKIYTSPKKGNHDYLIQYPTTEKNIRCAQQKQRTNFQSALEWSNKQALMMKKKSFIKTLNKQQKTNTKHKEHQLFIQKNSDQIGGWQK